MSTPSKPVSFRDVFVDMTIPGESVAFIIGQKGCTISRLKDVFSVNMAFLGENGDRFAPRTLRISPRNAKTIDEAREMVEEARQKIAKLCANSSSLIPEWKKPPVPLSSVRHRAASLESVVDCHKGLEEYIISVPNSLYPILLGRAGDQLKRIKKDYNLLGMEVGGVVVSEEGREIRKVKLRGEPNKVQAARQLIERILGCFERTKKDRPETTANGNSFSSSKVNGKESSAKQNGPPEWNGAAPKEKTRSSWESPPMKTEQKRGFVDDFVNSAGGGSPMATFSEGLKRVLHKHNKEVLKVADQFTAFVVQESEKDVKKAIAKSEAVNGDSSVEMGDLRSQLVNMNFRLDEMIDENQDLVAKLEDAQTENDLLKGQLDKMKLKLREGGSKSSANSVCVNCQVAPREMVLSDCLHCTHCKRCATQLKSCPVCGKKILNDKLQIYFK